MDGELQLAFDGADEEGGDGQRDASRRLSKFGRFSELDDTRVALACCALRVAKSGYIALEREDPDHSSRSASGLKPRIF
jgi:hypothetical protein